MTPLAAASFRDLFPNFEDQIETLHRLLVPVAVVLMIAGLLSTLRYATTPRSMMRALMSTVLIAATIALAADWMTLAQSSLQTVVQEMNASPQRTADRYLELTVLDRPDGGDQGRFSAFNLRLTFFNDMIVSGFLEVIGIVASVLIWMAYILQKLFLGFAYALAPLFLGMLALRSTSSIGVRYILGTGGLLLWPLGWAAASLGTSNLLDLFARQELVGFAPAYQQQTLLGGAIIGLWIILTTLISPVLIQRVIASGANIGEALAGGTLTSAGDAAKAGAGGLGASGSSLLGSSMRGGGGSFSRGSLQSLAPKLGTMAGSASSSGSSGSYDSSSSSSPSGGSTSSSTGATAPPQSLQQVERNPDLARDQRAAELIAQSRPNP